MPVPVHSHASDVFHSLFETVSEKVTAAVAASAIISPIWLPYAHDLAAQWAPILGCAWLLVQIVDKLLKMHRKPTEHGEE